MANMGARLPACCLLLLAYIALCRAHDVHEEEKTASEDSPGGGGEEYEKCFSKSKCYDDGAKCEERCGGYKPGLKKGPLLRWGCESKARWCRCRYTAANPNGVQVPYLVSLKTKTCKDEGAECEPFCTEWLNERGYSNFEMAECKARRPTCCCVYEDNQQQDDEKTKKEKKKKDKDKDGGGDSAEPHGDTITHKHEHTHQVADGHHEATDVRAASHSAPMEVVDVGEPVRVSDGRSHTCILMGGVGC